MEVRQSLEESSVRFIEAIGRRFCWLTVTWDGEEATFYGTGFAPIVSLPWYLCGAEYGQEYAEAELLQWEARRENGMNRDRVALNLGRMIIAGITLESEIRWKEEEEEEAFVSLKYHGRHGTLLMQVACFEGGRYVCTYATEEIYRRICKWKGVERIESVADVSAASLLPFVDAMLNRTSRGVVDASE